jgi:hypothetical protein
MTMDSFLLSLTLLIVVFKDQKTMFSEALFTMEKQKTSLGTMKVIFVYCSLNMNTVEDKVYQIANLFSYE